MTKIKTFKSIFLLVFVLNFGLLTAQNAQRASALLPTGGKAAISKKAVLKPNLAENAPGVSPRSNATQKVSNFNTGNGGGMTPNAMWDIQFDFGSLTSEVGVVWTGTEFWVTKWQNAPDSVFTYDVAGTYLGAFTITGIGSVRAMTTDGTYVYMANNTNAITKVTIATQLVQGTFNVPLLAGGQTAVRWITYDPSGAGGFWVGNFSTSLTKINNPAVGTTATVDAAATIPAATHTLTGMYGAAYDGTSPGGPYLWVNNQADPQGGTSLAMIVQVQLPSGTLTNIQHDVDADYGSPGGSAGGITIAQLPGYTQRSMIACNQGVIFVSYELNFSNAPFTDMQADSLDPTNGLSIWPISQNGPINFGGKVRNIGTATANNVTRSVRVLDGANAVLNTLTGTATTLNAGQSSVATFGPFTAPGQDIYTAQLITDATGDNNAANDTTLALFLVADTTLARDYASFGASVSAIGIGAAANTNKRLGQVMPLTNAAQLTTITAYFSSPYMGQQVSMSVYNMLGGLPNASLGSTATYTFTQIDQDSGVVLTLPLTSGNLNLPSGEFFLCVNELGDSTCGIATTSWIYAPGKQLVQWSTMPAPVGWVDIGGFGANFMRAFVLRANFGSACLTPITAAVTTTTTNCGTSTGSATVNVTAGTGPYTYTWSNNQTTQTATNLGVGSYTVTVNGQNGCSAVVNATVSAAPLVLNITPTNANCGQTNGSATATVTNYTGAVTYSWSNGQSGQNLMNVGPGTYTVTASAAAGCVGQGSVNISSSGGPTVTAMGVNPNCSGDMGSATATATGGTGTLTYSWSNGQTGASASNLGAGTYTVFVTDASQCVSTASVTITPPPALSGTATGTNPNCAGQTGQATASAVGGTAPYTYSWSNGMSGATIMNLTSNTYTVTITDSKGCTSTAQVTITVPAALSVSTSSTPSSGNNGTATATVTGGVPGYTYTWSTAPQQSTATAVGLAPGTYSVTITDSKGCTSTGSVTVQNSVSIDPSTLGISEMKAYPNPNQGAFTVQVELNNRDNVTLEIRDLTGKLIREVTQFNTLNINQQIELSGATKGIYILSVRTSKGATHQKVVVE